MKLDCVFPFFQQVVFSFFLFSAYLSTREPQIKWTVAHFPQDAGNYISQWQSSAHLEKFLIEKTGFFIASQQSFLMKH